MERFKNDKYYLLRLKKPQRFYWEGLILNVVVANGQTYQYVYEM